jgi:hypothetical protein
MNCVRGRTLPLALVAACSGTPNTQPETDAESSTSASQESGTESETGVEDCPAPDPDPEFNSYYFYLAHPDWPYAPFVEGEDPPTEYGLCTVTSIESATDENTGEYFDILFDCLHDDGQNYPQRMVLRTNPNHELAIASWPTLGPLELRFLDSSIWDEHLRYQYVSIRDAEGRLLFAGIHSNPPGSDAVPLGLVPGDVTLWYAPFSGFTVVDPGCSVIEVDRLDYLGFPTQARRLAVEFEVDAQVLTLYDKASLTEFETSVGHYDLFVGQAFEIVESTCLECPPFYVHLHAIFQPD